MGIIQKGTFYSEVQDAIKALPAFQEAQASRIRELCEARLTENDAYAFIVKAVMQKVLNSKYVYDVANEFKSPSHDYGELSAPSLYTLTQAFTTALGKNAERNPIVYANRTMQIARLLTPAPLALSA